MVILAKTGKSGYVGLYKKIRLIVIPVLGPFKYLKLNRQVQLFYTALYLINIPTNEYYSVESSSVTEAH